ncbi:iron(III) transport system ATP-binding protein [Ekhidna lutea]|uniref:Iron(III) transport system ATP-binding protein n=1 Tax=Ekhidna lutea TaxID=447679 RepID=A0A239GWR8_EKHLU|nr:ABC transporter ATP-binding protein [Ekhidna lutea]SNS72504.1 iron(III) transport system ATP-binding protein [Ekhidna lutea]
MSFLKLQNIQKSYSQERKAFACPSLEISKGGKVGIAGETGSGKSTLLKIIAGLEKPDEGEVFMDNESVYPKLDRLIPGHPEIAYLSQSFELPKFIKVIEFLHSSSIEEERFDQITRLCRVKGLLDKDTFALSGGERQRVALAKVILKEPVVLLLDEPYSNLDPHHERIIKEVIRDISKETDATILMVSHDPSDLLPWADKVLILKDGEIAQIGAPKEVYYKPVNEYTAGLFGDFQKLDGSKWSSLKQDLIVRPEQLTLNNHGKTGEVQAVYFHGNHELIEVKTDNETIQALASPGTYQKGDKVGVSIKLSDYPK